MCRVEGWQYTTFSITLANRLQCMWCFLCVFLFCLPQGKLFFKWPPPIGNLPKIYVCERAEMFKTGSPKNVLSKKKSLHTNFAMCSFAWNTQKSRVPCFLGPKINAPTSKVPKYGPPQNICLPTGGQWSSIILMHILWYSTEIGLDAQVWVPAPGLGLGLQW